MNNSAATTFFRSVLVVSALVMSGCSAAQSEEATESDDVTSSEEFGTTDENNSPKFDVDRKLATSDLEAVKDFVVSGDGFWRSLKKPAQVVIRDSNEREERVHRLDGGEPLLSNVTAEAMDGQGFRYFHWRTDGEGKFVGGVDFKFRCMLMEEAGGFTFDCHSEEANVRLNPLDVISGMSVVIRAEKTPDGIDLSTAAWVNMSYFQLAGWESSVEPLTGIAPAAANLIESEFGARR